VFDIGIDSACELKIFVSLSVLSIGGVEKLCLPLRNWVLHPQALDLNPRNNKAQNRTQRFDNRLIIDDAARQKSGV
jgi:hypothetical protein